MVNGTNVFTSTGPQTFHLPENPTLAPLYGPWACTPPSPPDMFKLVDYEEQIVDECVVGISQKFYLVLLYILFIFLKLW